MPVPILLFADGVDIDYEPASSGCTWSAAAVKCATDAEFIRVSSQGLLSASGGWSNGTLNLLLRQRLAPPFKPGHVGARAICGCPACCWQSLSPRLVDHQSNGHLCSVPSCQVVTAFRAAFPRPYILTTAAWSIGAPLSPYLLTAGQHLLPLLLSTDCLCAACKAVLSCALPSAAALALVHHQDHTCRLTRPTSPAQAHTARARG